jgi:hypothetical protein
MFEQIAVKCENHWCIENATFIAESEGDITAVCAEHLLESMRVQESAGEWA